MTLQPPPAGQNLPREPFDHAIQQVNEWRGRCLDAFSRAEQAVTECLVAMSEMPERGRHVRLPHLVGQRYDALSATVAETGPFAADAALLAGALERFRAHDPLRTMLAHGVTEITLSAQAHWTLILRIVCLRSRQPTRTMLALRQNEANAVRKTLVADSRCLCAKLDVVRSRLSPTS